MLADYVPLVLLAVIASLFVGLSLVVSTRLGPKRPNPTKRVAYESGIIPEQRLGGTRFPVQFYLIAMLFILFDVEAIFLHPWAVVLRDLGWYGLGVMAVFILLLFESYFYILRRGGLEWE